MCVLQCLIAARDGFDAETSSEILRQLCVLEESLSGGAIPNATLVKTHDKFSICCVITYKNIYFVNKKRFIWLVYVGWLQFPCLCTGFASDPQAKKRAGKHRRSGLSLEQKCSHSLQTSRGIDIEKRMLVAMS